MRMKLETVGTWLFVLIAVAIGLSVLLSFAMNLAADDLRAQASLARGQEPDTNHTAVSIWLSARIAPDVADQDLAFVDQRSGELDHRADRIRELAAAASVAGLVLALATARPEARIRSAQSASSGLANTRSNGTV
jgi:hypothetical protein